MISFEVAYKTTGSLQLISLLKMQWYKNMFNYSMLDFKSVNQLPVIANHIDCAMPTNDKIVPCGGDGVYSSIAVFFAVTQGHAGGDSYNSKGKLLNSVKHSLDM